MLPHTNNPTLAGTRLSVFDRAKMRLGIRSKESDSGQVSNASSNSPTSLLEKFHSLKGAEKTTFFRLHKVALLKADAASQDKVNVSSPARSKQEHSPAGASSVSNMPSSRNPVTSSQSSDSYGAATALLEKFDAMKGAEKTSCFRNNKTLLKAAGAVVSARESTGEAQAVRNFAAAQAAAPHRPSGADLLATFHTLSGTAKTSFFRANHAALKIAAINEAR